MAKRRRKVASFFKKRHAEFLKSPEWKALSLQIKRRDNFKCQFVVDKSTGEKCGSKHKLQVHHKRYRFGLNCDHQYLVTLCHKHHEFVTQNHRII